MHDSALRACFFTLLVAAGFSSGSACGADLVSDDIREAPRSPIAALRNALQDCRALPDAKRLACFDQLAQANAPPDYSGKLGFRTELFTVAEPTRLRFRSQGVIFVLYVLTESNEVLQNLHLGGGGEGDYVIKNPGRYKLQIDGSARWQIWLEPAEELASSTGTNP
ncbi:MAG: hypothetical protein AAF671_13225 [Pseudomonadota bacterium]